MRSMSSRIGCAVVCANISASMTSPSLRLGRAAFDHHDRVLRARRRRGRCRACACCSNVGNATNSPSTRATRTAAIGPAPRDVRDVERRARRRHREDVGRVLLVAREDGRDDLRVVLEALGEERPARAVDEARGEDLLVALAPLALEEAARDLAGGERLLDVVAGEGEEVDARALVAADGGDEDDALAVGDEDGAVRLLGEAARLEDERLAVDDDGFTNEMDMAVMRSWAQLPRACGETPSTPPAFDPRFASASAREATAASVRTNRRAKGRADGLEIGYRDRAGALPTSARCAGNRRLLAEVERADDLAIPLEARALEVVEQAPPLRDHAQQAAARVVVLHVRLEVLGEVA